MIIDLKESDTRKIQITIAINFISSKDAEEERVMHSKNNDIKFSSYNDVNEVVDKLSDWLSVQLMYYKCHKVNFRDADSYIDKKEKSKIKSEK